MIIINLVLQSKSGSILGAHRGELLAMAGSDKKPGLSTLPKLYLLAYNGILSAGWLLILMQTIRYTVLHRKTLQHLNGYVPGLYADLQGPLKIFQTAAFMEVVHSIVGLVSSSAVVTFLQVYSRIFLLWAVLVGVQSVSNGIGLLLIAYAWSITEVVRYAFYFFSLLDNVPYLIKWARYTLFFVLYPIGVLGELLLIFSAIPVVAASEQWSIFLPNYFNISFHFSFFLGLTALLYIPIFPQLYGHMIAQRKKVLGAKTKAE